MQRSPSQSKLWSWLVVVILLGFALRASLAVLAEQQLDCDESTVALMSLDILEQGARPMFFYGGSYNGGAAFEAYLGALVIGLFGFSALSFKLILSVLWAATALLFADLCRRNLPPARALCAVAFLCLGTPFFLEWSTTARGGFAETLFFSTLLLWLAGARGSALENPLARAAGFGIAAGIALWASEMILPLLPFAAAWFVQGVPAERRLRAAAVGLASLAIGLLPLIAYNASHDWQHLAESAMASLLQGGGPALSGEQLLASLHFVLGPGAGSAGLLALGVALGALGLALAGLRGRPLTLAHLMLAQTLAYGLGYWLSGLRFLDIPPSRVLYPLHINLAVLLACSLHFEGAGTWNKLARGLSSAAVLVWVASTSLALIQWGASGEPRASGSWRASWCLIDGAGLRSALLERRVDVAFVNYWTATPLALANRIALRGDSNAPRVVPATRLPENPRPGQSAAVVLHRESPVLALIERKLQGRAIAYERWHWGSYAVLSELDSTKLSASGLALSPRLEEGTRPPAPRSRDGFN